MPENKDFAIQIFSDYPPYPFEYDSESQHFHVGDERIGLMDYDPDTIGVRESISSDKARQMIEEAHLVMDVGQNLHIMPTMNRWLLSLDKDAAKSLFSSTTKVMIDTYGELTGMSRSKLLEGSHWGFGAHFIRPGHFDLTVLGDCACYGVGLYGMFGEDNWPEGFASLERHNIDRSEQWISLLAGAGTIAYLSARNQT